MRMKKLFVVLAALALATSSAVLVGCGGGSSSGSISSGPQMGTVNTSISDPPTCAAPAGPYSHVYVTITDVKVHQSATADANVAGWVDLSPGMAPKQIDLLGTASTQCFLAQLGATRSEERRVGKECRL